MRQKILISLITALLLVVIVSGTALAGNTGAGQIYDEMKNKGSVSGNIWPDGKSSADNVEILEKLDKNVSDIVATVRVIATIFAVVFIIWIGLTLFTAGANQQKLYAVKTQVAMFFIALVCIFMAEPIVRFVLSWFIKID